MLHYEPFYRNFGVRKIAHFLQPPLPVLEQLALPQRSILHFVCDNPLSVGPAVDEFVFRQVTKPIQMGHVTDLKGTLGNPRRRSVAVAALQHTYHTKHRRFRPMRDLAAASRDDQTLVVYNYGLLPALYTYQRSQYTEYNRWMNIQSTLWAQVATLCQESDRHQFVLLSLPRVLPSIPNLKLGTSGAVNQKLVQLFHTPEALELLQLWMWFGPERAQSMLAQIPEDKLSRVNLVFQESGRWFVLNLGVVNDWRRTPKDEEGEHAKGIDAASFQRRFLRLMMSLSHVRTDAAPEVDAVVDATTPAPVAVAEVTVIKRDASLPARDPVTGVVSTKTEAVVTDDPSGGAATDRGEDVTQDSTVQKRIDDDLAELERIEVEGPNRESDDGDEWQVQILAQPNLEEGLMRVCNRLADAGALSAAEYRRYQAMSEAYKSLPAPDGSGHLGGFVQIPPETLAMAESPKMKDIPAVVDKTMLHSSLLEFDQRYIEQVLQKDVAGMVLNLQHAGIAITAYEAKKVEDVLGDYYDYSVRVTPVEGTTSTLRFKLPALEDDGTYTSNGTKYRLRKQRGDVPIRKIGPDRVALTSYYGKVFVSRSPKRVNDYGQWLRNQVMAIGLDPADLRIQNMHPGNVFDASFEEAPRVYSALAMGFRSFTLKPQKYDRTSGNTPWDISLDFTEREKLYGGAALGTYEREGGLIIGHKLTGAFLVMDQYGALYEGLNGNLREIGNFEYLLGLEAEKAPVDFAEVKILGRTIPVGLILGYELGLERLCTFLKVTPRRVPAGTRAAVDESEYALVFSDETLVFPRDNVFAAIVLAGFREYHQSIRGYAVHEFDKPGVYFNVLESGGPSTRYLREIDLLQQLFVDRITRDLLVEMKEPTNFRGLLLRSCELLLSDHHPAELDPAHMRIKGYERLAGAVYSELVRTVRAHNGRSGKARLPLDLNPYAVWTAVAQDPSVSLVSDINPIENLKQLEAVTYSGTGGRGSRSMTKHTREYHRNDMGTISESTVDSSDVAINTFTSADPQFTSLRGMSRRYQVGKTGATALLSTSALLSPGSDKDDPKRVNFVGIQHSHAVACSGYRQAAVRTGYEQVIAHRTGDLFAYTAKKPGKVLSVSDTGMIVQFDDGSTKGFELGRRYGNAAGLTIPHDVETSMKEGQSFAVGDLLTHNPGFFERDFLNPNSVVWKAGIIVKTALMETTQTLEDSSAISARAAALLSTNITKVKTVLVNFDQSVRRLVKVGAEVDSQDILCIIEDAVTADNQLFDEESLDTLRLLSAQTPLAKAKGVVERVEVFYHGDKEDMSQSLRDLVTASDREMGKRHKSFGRKAFTGSVDEGFRVDGDPLSLDTLAIRVYITGSVKAGAGDKGVFANQMKTVFGEIMTHEMRTESGTVIDAVFGAKSVADRIVNSFDIIGTTTTLLGVIGKRALAAYKS